ncbi:MAG: cytochrome c3 family protein [Chloroflexi bacterium]|nr:cytochrome c3 family protein [Chloroflexota bacterium]MCH7655922.1 cytochrome c3 family protein [Chloroflexota bacterium]
MNSRLVKTAIAVMGASMLLVFGLVAWFLFSAWWSSPPPILGFGDGPEQPIAFPHTVHVSDAGIDCQFCHRTVSTDEAATIPAVAQCLFCHDFNKIDGSLSESGTAQVELAKLIADLGETQEPINWARVYRLPDHVQFVHAPHIQQGISCSTCHGDIASMQVVKQVRNLKMRDCVDCHKANNAPTDCSTCHY